MTVTKEEILKIAKLSKLSINDSDLEELTKEMSNIIAFADEINNIEENRTDFDNINNLSNVFREDVVEDSFDRNLILKNVSGGEDGFFVVKKRM